MRVIFYIMDGVSALKVRSYNNDNINKDIPLTYLDELYKKGFSSKYCYGFDNTQSSFYSFMTGLRHHHSKVSIARNCNLLDYDRSKTIPSLFKQKGFKTHYFSNNYMHNPGVIQDGFEKVIYDFENYDLANLKIDEEFDSYFGIDNEKDTFVTIHDFYTHDQNAQYSKGKYTLTSDEYETLIVEHANKLQSNLHAIRFNEEKDYLILISDHGMTVDSSVFKDKGDDESLWSLNSKELKARVLCNIIGPDIEKYEFKNPCTLRELFFTFVDKFKLSDKLNKPELNLLSKPKQEYVFSINAGNAAVKQPSKTTFHQFMCVTQDRKKYIYQDNIDKLIEYYDLENDYIENNPTLLMYEDIPNDFKKYIEKYKNSRSISFKHIISHLKQVLNKNNFLHIIRNYKKIPKKLIKVLGLNR